MTRFSCESGMKLILRESFTCTAGAGKTEPAQWVGWKKVFVNPLKPFSSSIDWGNAFVDSLIWIARGWAIAAICTLTVLALIARFTAWGHQFWTVTGATSPGGTA